MRFVRLPRPSPGTVLGVIALVVALAGTAGALPGKNIVDSGDLKRNAVKSKKIARKAVKSRHIARGAVKGPQVNEAKLGKVPRATDADTVGGLTAGQLESRAFSQTTELVTLPPGPGVTIVQTLNLPAGTYLITARGEFNNNNAALAGAAVRCQLVAGTTFASPGQALLSCERFPDWVAGNVIDPTISAISAQQ